MFYSEAIKERISCMYVVNKTFLNHYLLEFTARNFHSFVLKSLKVLNNTSSKYQQLKMISQVRKTKRKKLQISCIYETSVIDLSCLNYCLLECTARNLHSFLLKIMKILSFQNKNFFWETVLGQIITSK